MDHVDETVGAIVLAELAHGHPPHLGGIAARLELAAHPLGHVVDDDVVIADGVLLADHAVDDAAEAEQAHLEAAFLLHLADGGVLQALAQIHEAAGDAPPPQARGLAPASEEHAFAVEHDGAHAHARGIGELAGRWHQTMVSARGARPDRVHSSVAYFSRSSMAARAVSSSLRLPGVRTRPCALRKPSASASAASSNEGRRPSTASSVVMAARGSCSAGNTCRSRAGSAPSMMAPCCRKAEP